jgi:hypothetical protein
VNQSRSFYHTGVQKGMTIEYQEIKNAEHRFIPKGGKMSCSLGEISQKTIDFLCAHL